ncbi:hypothetical protein B0A49_07834 [Cryomyces minteri]|uniref:Uncharacterized protein n=1 Tax=Cryomyces minteri TaxID=331657 RepID=A0A4U0WSX3_9PEZI|nr:hypothetical protein B0A49_07834 [Cryomyces minteri]
MSNYALTSHLIGCKTIKQPLPHPQLIISISSLYSSHLTEPSTHSTAAHFPPCFRSPLAFLLASVPCLQDAAIPPCQTRPTAFEPVILASRHLQTEEASPSLFPSPVLSLSQSRQRTALPPPPSDPSPPKRHRRESESATDPHARGSRFSHLRISDASTRRAVADLLETRETERTTEGRIWMRRRSKSAERQSGRHPCCASTNSGSSTGVRGQPAPLIELAVAVVVAASPPRLPPTLAVPVRVAVTVAAAAVDTPSLHNGRRGLNATHDRVAWCERLAANNVLPLGVCGDGLAVNEGGGAHDDDTATDGDTHAADSGGPNPKQCCSDTAT